MASSKLEVVTYLKLTCPVSPSLSGSQSPRNHRFCYQSIKFCPLFYSQWRVLVGGAVQFHVSLENRAMCLCCCHSFHLRTRKHLSHLWVSGSICATVCRSIARDIVSAWPAAAVRSSASSRLKVGRYQGAKLAVTVPTKGQVRIVPKRAESEPSDVDSFLLPQVCGGP